MPGLDAEVARVGAMLRRIRRQLHTQPELAFQEVATAALAARHCAALGFRVRTGVGGTGVLADMDGGSPGPTVLVRADMDALPVEEGDDGRPWKSTVPGVMHACGHDGHVAIALGVAQVMTRLRPSWPGRLRMCFQPAEEVDVGAERMIADGALAGVDSAVGLHLQAGIPTGTVAVGSGPQWASSDELRLTIRGAGGHAADPSQTIDPIAIAAEIILELRRLSAAQPGDVPARATIAQISAGTAPNVTPETAVLAGTLRAIDPTDRRRLLAEVRDVTERIVRDRRAALSFELGAHVPALVCDPDATDLVRAALADAPLRYHVTDGQPSTAADDMARFLDAVPGCYFRVGASAPGLTVRPHHHPLFDIDEAALDIGTDALARAALAFLTND